MVEEFQIEEEDEEDENHASSQVSNEGLPLE